MLELIEVINETYNKSSRENFEDFLERHNYCDKFFVSSDYCIRDKTKPNDTISIVVFPYNEHFLSLKDKIQKYAPSDLKKTRNINSSFADYMHSGDVFVFCFSISDFDGLTEHEDCELSKVEVARKSFEETVAMISGWIDVEPKKEMAYKEIIKVVKKGLSQIQSKNANVSIFQELILICLLISYVSFLICKQRESCMLGWFPDRDRILSKYDGLAPQLVHLNLNGLLQWQKVDCKYEFVCGVPEASGDVWFDQLVRVADYIAGTIADYDRMLQKCSHDKHCKILEQIIASNNNILLYDLSVAPGGYSMSRIMIERSVPA